VSASASMSAVQILVFIMTPVALPIIHCALMVAPLGIRG
jgi:hypothetical protein